MFKVTNCYLERKQEGVEGSELIDIVVGLRLRCRVLEVCRGIWYNLRRRNAFAQTIGSLTWQAET